MTRTRVLLVDDHELFREGLAGILRAQPDFEVVGEACDGLEAVVMARSLSPDLVLMDIQMPGKDGVEAAREIKRSAPDTQIVMLTVRSEDEKLFEAIKAGAQGYLLKDIRAADLLAMVRGALRGEAAISPVLAGRVLGEFRRLSQQVPAAHDEEDPFLLSPREQEVLGRIASGDSDKEIADSLCISLNTVKTHVRSILAKLHVGNRREAAWAARRKGLV